MEDLNSSAGAEVVDIPAASPTPTSDAPSSAPAAPSAGAAPSTPVPDSGAEQPSRTPGESIEAFLGRFHEWEDKAAALQAGQPPVEKPVTDAKVDNEAAKVDKPAEVTPEKPVAEVDPLDALGPLPAKQVADILNANPELEQMMAEKGIAKEPLYESLRLAGFGSQVKELFGDLDSAKFAHQGAEKLAVMDRAFTEIQAKDIPSTIKFVQDVLLPMSFLLDEQGNPKKDPESGLPLTDGTVQTFIENIREVAFDQIKYDANQLLQNPQTKELAENLLAAADIFTNYLDGKPQTQAEMSEEMKQERAQIDADKQAMADTRNRETSERHQRFVESVMTASNEKLDGMIAEWLKQSSLAPQPGESESEKQSKQFMQTSISKEIRDALFAEFNASNTFKYRQEELGRREPGETTKAELVNHYVTQAKGKLERIAAPILKKAGGARIAQLHERTQKIAAQQKASQMEPRGGTRPALPKTQETDPAALMKQARDTYVAQYRRQPSTEQLMAEFRKLEAASLVSA